MRGKKAAIELGIQHVRRMDPVMNGIIPRCAPLTELRLERNRFLALVNSILSQQISVHAARSIKARLLERTAPTGITPGAIADLGPDELRGLGVSRQKAHYVTDLAHRVLCGDVALEKLGYLTDEVVIRQLTQVHGIGVWTAQMFLIFALGRLDVFPYDDYGVRAAIQRLYGLDGLPDKAASLGIAERWRPYRTIASWYCWRSHELS